MGSLRSSSRCRVASCIVIGLTLLSSVSSAYRYTSKNSVQSLQELDPDIKLYDDHGKHERKIFDYWRNGVKLDLRVVPADNNSISSDDDHFPAFPAKDIGLCMLDFSMLCIRDRMARYIIAMSSLDKINLYGKNVKLVKIRSLPAERWDERSLDPVKRVDQSIDDFFDSFALRITLPKGRGRREMNQLEVMYEDREIEGRGGKGGSKGGKGGGCKKMMMCMVMAAKMKMMGMVGLMSMKGLMMAGLSMMMTKAMLIMQLMNKKGGGGGHGGGGYGGGGYGGGGGGQLKEIVLLTKSSGGGGGGCGGGGGGGCGGGSPPPSSSYGAPPSSSYGAPPASSYGAPPPTGGGGGGGYDFNAQGGGGGGGWGRSFGNGIPMTTNTEQLSNRPSQIVNTSGIIGRPEFQEKFIDQNWMTNHQPEGERIGEVVEIAETSNNHYENTNLRADSKLNIQEISSGNNIVEPRVVYADNWRNYEATDRIWDTVGPIVATRIVTDKLGKS